MCSATRWLGTSDTSARTKGASAPSAITRRCTGCVVADLVLIGMDATLPNGARVGSHSIIAAGTVLGEGQQVPEGVLVAGVPGKVRRERTEAARRDRAQRRHHLEITRLHRHAGA